VENRNAAEVIMLITRNSHFSLMLVIEWWTIFVSYSGISDEEIGGKDGMAKFVNTSDFLELNVGFALDEGMASPSEQFPLFYGERSIWRKCGPFTSQFLVFLL